MPADPATVDDVATAMHLMKRLAVRFECFAQVLTDPDPAARAGWEGSVADAREQLVQVGNALWHAHRREVGEPPPAYLSTSRARRCGHDVIDRERSMACEAEVVALCGAPSGWRFLYPDDATAMYACPDHEEDLRQEAARVGAQVEQLLR